MKRASVNRRKNRLSATWYLLAPLFYMLLPLLLEQHTVLAQSALTHCAEQFIGDDIKNAPTLANSPATDPERNNRQLCYRANGKSFFAIDYWPKNLSPRWAAYKLSPENYGPRGCSIASRSAIGCYFRGKDWSAIEGGCADPSHVDHMLAKDRLSPRDFRFTGYDRGNMVPRSAVGWHVCGAYDAFSMANISPMSPLLNRRIWASLESQVLTWAFDVGPIYVTTGTMFSAFPTDKFWVFNDGFLDSKQVYQPGVDMRNVLQPRPFSHSLTQYRMLRHLGRANPERISDRVRDMLIPTGYFKVIFRPATKNEEAHAIGFLVPHTYEDLNQIEDLIPNIGPHHAFWAFVAPIKLIENATGIRFPGIPEEMKTQMGDLFFDLRFGAHNVRNAECGAGTPAGIIKHATSEQRRAACLNPTH